nr:MAG TPA: hypothetical protein [Caudoviricetes sp.]
MIVVMFAIFCIIIDPPETFCVKNVSPQIVSKTNKEKSKRSTQHNYCYLL